MDLVTMLAWLYIVQPEESKGTNVPEKKRRVAHAQAEVYTCMWGLTACVVELVMLYLLHDL